MDLEEFIIKFFHDLPRATIVCISVLGDTYARFLRALLPYEYSAHAWIMFSRLNSDNAPIVIALPLDSVLTGKYVGKQFYFHVCLILSDVCS